MLQHGLPNDCRCKFNDPYRISGQISVSGRLLGDCSAIARPTPWHTNIFKISDPSRISGQNSVARRLLGDCSSMANDCRCKFSDPYRISSQISVSRRLLGDCPAIARRLLDPSPNTKKSIELATPTAFLAKLRLIVDKYPAITNHQPHRNSHIPPTTGH